MDTRKHPLPPKETAGTWTWVFPLEVWRFRTWKPIISRWTMLNFRGVILYHLTHLTDNAPDFLKYQPPTEGGYQITKKTWWIHSVEKTYHMLVKLGESFQRIEKKQLETTTYSGKFPQKPRQVSHGELCNSGKLPLWLVNPIPNVPPTQIRPY